MWPVSRAAFIQAAPMMVGCRFISHLGSSGALGTLGAQLHRVIFVRHGQAAWNKDNRFMGWTDIGLTDKGVAEAVQVGKVLASYGVHFDECHSSVLDRCIVTSKLILDELNQTDIPLICHWRLNERNYGALAGWNKKKLVDTYGLEQMKRWRESYDERPPPVDKESIYYAGNDPKYRDLKEEDIPVGESLHDTRLRTSKYWDEVLMPRIKEGKSLMIVSHKNALRSLFMHIDGISPQDVAKLEVPRAVPVCYLFDSHMHPIRQESSTGFMTGAFWGKTEEDLKNMKDKEHHQIYGVKGDKTTTTAGQQVIGK